MLSNKNNGDEAQGASSQDDPKSGLSRMVDRVAYAASIISAGLVILTLAMTGFSVFRRYVLGRPLTWSDELGGFLVIAIVMLGAAEVLRRGDHVSVDILTENAAGKKRRLLGIWSALAVAIVSAVLFVSAVNSVRFSWMIGVYSDGYLEAPLWIVQSFLMIGSGLLFAVAAVRCFDLIFKGPRQP